jgi:hypothetical protein
MGKAMWIKRLVTPVSGLSAIIAIVVALAVPAAWAVPFEFTAILDGPSESPPNPSPGTGFVDVLFDITAHTMLAGCDGPSDWAGGPKAR